MKLKRLDAIIAGQLNLSRSQAVQTIRGSHIQVDGRAVKDPSVKICPEISAIHVFGEPLVYDEYLYLMMNKPGGVLSAARDKKCKTVIDLIPQQLRRKGLFPAGRLDKDTEGLLILTDDGDFAHQMLSPKKEVYKTYIAEVDKLPVPDAVHLFLEGLTIDSGDVCASATLEILDNRDKPTVKVMICEGMFHQVKRMLKAVGSEVTFLRRVQIGKLRLDEDLILGNCKKLKKSEIALIFE